MPNSTPSAKPQLQLSPTATRLLVVAVYALLGIATLLAVVAFFKHASVLLLPMAVCFILICVPWTMLRMSINSADSAPISKLDDYEAEVLDHWRHHALRLATFLLSALAVFLLIVGNFRPDFFDNHFTANQVLIIAGFLALVAYLLVSTLPAVGYALTFNQPVED